MSPDSNTTSTGPRRFVVLHHTGFGPEHWDLMLEEDDALATWQLHRHPATLDAGPIPATRIADHRKTYLTYEGPVGGDRGQVRIVDRGSYTSVSTDSDTLTTTFTGQYLAGPLSLRRVATDRPDWTLARKRRFSTPATPGTATLT